MSHSSKPEYYGGLKKAKSLAIEIDKFYTPGMSDEEIFKHLSALTHDPSLIDDAIVLWAIGRTENEKNGNETGLSC